MFSLGLVHMGILKIMTVQGLCLPARDPQVFRAFLCWQSHSFQLGCSSCTDSASAPNLTAVYLGVQVHKCRVGDPLHPNWHGWDCLHRDSQNTFASPCRQTQPSHKRMLKYTRMNKALSVFCTVLLDSTWRVSTYMLSALMYITNFVCFYS